MELQDYSTVASRGSKDFLGTTHRYAIVDTRSGKVRGSVADEVNAFEGIPYRAPRFGANRLLPPRAVEAWSGVRDALAYVPRSPQPEYSLPMDQFIPELTVTG